ncbi:MAG TPA: hypothetical protein VHO69_07525 [Phototrophicaceae bacterium]|nr:hypothetical protein [Phototrophicaceae bacterium]
MGAAKMWMALVVLDLLFSGAADGQIKAQDDNVPHEIAFISCPRDYNPVGDIYLYDLDHDSTRRLTDTPAHYSYLSWSPDGTQLLFASDETGEYMIYVMDVEDESIRPLIPGFFPTWSPDGTRIAYGVAISGEHEQGIRFALYVMNADTTDQRRITPDEFASTGSPAWSPDAQQIVFAARRGSDGYIDLYSLDLETETLTQLTFTTPIIESRPTFAPDGEYFAFSSDDGANMVIYKMRMDGSGLTLLTPIENGVRKYNPAWSPDGSAIAYQLQYAFNPQPGEHDGIYVMQADGRDSRLIFENGCAPAWRPVLATGTDAGA